MSGPAADRTSPRRLLVRLNEGRRPGAECDVDAGAGGGASAEGAAVRVAASNGGTDALVEELTGPSGGFRALEALRKLKAGRGGAFVWASGRREDDGAEERW